MYIDIYFFCANTVPVREATRWQCGDALVEQAEALLERGFALEDTGDVGAAVEMYQLSLGNFRAVGDRNGEGRSLINNINVT